MVTTMAREPEIMSKLPHMTPKELREVQSRVAFLLDRTSSSASDDEQFVQDLLSDAMRREGITCPPLSQIFKMQHAAVFREGVHHFMEYVQMEFRPEDRIKLVKICKILIDIMILRLREMHVPVAHRTLCQQLLQIGDCVEWQFPGYKDSGLLPSVVLQFKIMGED